MILVVLFLGLILRLINLDQSFWLDEAISALAVRDYTFWGIVTQFSPGDTHPPLYYLVLKLWASIFGFWEISLRGLSVLFGVLTVYVIFLIGKRIGGKKLGFLSSLFLSTAPLHVYYSQEVRMYSFSTLAVSLAILFFKQVLDKVVTGRKWILFSLSILLVGLIDYLPLLILPVFWIYPFIKKRNVDWWKKFVISHVPLSAFLFVWFPVFSQQSLGTGLFLASFSGWSQVLGEASPKELALVWIKFILGRISFSPQVYLLIITIASALFIYSLLKALVLTKRHLILWLWLVLPPVLAFMGSLFVPGFSYFRLIFVLPAFYILVGVGILSARLGKLLIAAILLLNLLFSAVYILREEFWREDWRSTVSYIEGKIVDGEVVLMIFPEPFAPYRWYGKKLTSVYGIKKDLSKEEVDLSPLKDKKDIYTFDYLMDLTDPQRFTYRAIQKQGFGEVEVYNFRGVGQIRYWRKQ